MADLETPGGREELLNRVRRRLALLLLLAPALCALLALVLLAPGWMRVGIGAVWLALVAVTVVTAWRTWLLLRG